MTISFRLRSVRASSLLSYHQLIMKQNPSEHVEVMIRTPRQTSDRMSRAGLKLLGMYYPCAASDYAVGTDHVIPTGGYAARRGGLSVLDFLRLGWTVTGSKEVLRRLLQPLKTLPYVEGLPNHYPSANSRFEE